MSNDTKEFFRRIREPQEYRIMREYKKRGYWWEKVHHTHGVKYIMHPPTGRWQRFCNWLNGQ